MILIFDESDDGHKRLCNGLSNSINAPIIRIPPLRERLEDIPSLVKGLMRDFAGEPGDLSPSIIQILVRHNWPGNLAELKKTVRWLTTQNTGMPSETDLISYLGDTFAEAKFTSISQRNRIIQALLLNNLNRTKTAKHLGVTRRTLYNQIKKYTILTE